MIAKDDLHRATDPLELVRDDAAERWTEQRAALRPLGKTDDKKIAVVNVRIGGGERRNVGRIAKQRHELVEVARS